MFYRMIQIAINYSNRIKTHLRSEGDFNELEVQTRLRQIAILPSIKVPCRPVKRKRLPAVV